MSNPARAHYQEDDWIAEVEIVEDRSTTDTEAYTLRVVSTVQASRRYTPVPDGTEFRCMQRHGTHQTFTLRRPAPAPADPFTSLAYQEGLPRDV